MQTSEIPLREPPELRAGVTWQWRREDLTADYPATGWTLKYWMKQRAAAGGHIEIQATADSANFAVSVAAATTAAYTAGKYDWAAVVSGGSSEVYEIDRGVLIVLARFDQASALDFRTHAERMLEAIETALVNKAELTPDQAEYTIGTRHLKRLTPKELLDWRDYYRAEVSQQAMTDRVRKGQGGNRLVWRL
jgi:hypothetical protein